MRKRAEYQSTDGADQQTCLRHDERISRRRPFQAMKANPTTSAKSIFVATPKFRQSKFFWLLFGALFCSGACRGRDNGPAKVADALPVETAVLTIETERFAASVTVTGTLVSVASVDVKAETVGRVVRFDKMEGENVRAGETVVWVDEENHRLTLHQAESAVQVAEAVVEKARVMEAHSRSELERARNLLQSGGITEKDLKAAQVAEQDSRAQLKLAIAQLNQAQATLRVAQKRLRDCQVRAPVAGQIQKKFVNPGAYVEAQTPLFALVDNHKLELESPVASAELSAIRPLQKVVFMVNSFPGEPFEGRVREISPAVDAETRAAKVRIQLNNSRDRLKAGMFVQGEIVTGVQSQAIVIPASAVYRDDRSAKESFVFIVENSRAVRRRVRIGQEWDQKLQIVQGLKPGDLLVAEQSIELAEGVGVKPRR